MGEFLTLIWNILSNIGNLPDEIVVKILYEFNGMSHPLVAILLHETKIKYYDDLQNLPFSKFIQNHYYNYGYNLELNNIMINKHKYFKIHNYASYINFNDPGYLCRMF